MSETLRKKRSFDEALNNAHDSIKTLKLEESAADQLSSSTGSDSLLLPPPATFDDANYNCINPILREAHFLRQLRVSQKKSSSGEGESQVAALNHASFHRTPVNGNFDYEDMEN